MWLNSGCCPRPVEFSSNEQTGFSLIEIILVIVLIGAWAAIVAPRVPVATVQEDGFFTQVIAAVRYAQKVAVSSGCAVQITTTAADIVILQEDAPCPSATFNTAVLNPGTGEPFSTTHPRGLNRPDGVSFNVATVTFDRIGRSATGQADIMVSGSTVRTIRVEGETGFVHEI